MHSISDRSTIMEQAQKRVVIIGTGRFGNAAAQGIREGHVQCAYGSRVGTDVIQLSATRFVFLPPSEMAQHLIDAEFVVYCGTNLPTYTNQIAQAMREAKAASTSAMEFIDFSNPDPINEQGDLSGAIDIWVELNSNQEAAAYPVWKICNVASLDVAGTEGTSKGLVYAGGDYAGDVPRLKIPGLHWEAAPKEKADLYGEAHHRIMERANVDRWWDGTLLGLAVFFFTSAYAICRYSVHINGEEPDANIVMYLLDKSFAWTGLWMMVASPFAGNILALMALFKRFGDLPVMDKMVTLFATVMMIIPTVFFSLCYVFWIVIRNAFFMNRGIYALYRFQPQSMSTEVSAWFKASMVDLVTLKGESGCMGFLYALVHSFLGCIIADVAYKGYWFGPNGRLIWRMELSMTTGCISTALLGAVAMRSVMGHASWIRLKPMYTYMSPIGVWFATLHVVAFGVKGWTTLFKLEYHHGQMSITFVSSMFPCLVLLTHHFFGLFGTKKRASDEHLWRHSLIDTAHNNFTKLTESTEASAGNSMQKNKKFSTALKNRFTSQKKWNSSNHTQSTQPDLF